jgi:hypothetical protein
MQDQEPSAPRYSKPGHCGTYGRGHDVLYLAALKTHSCPQVKGQLAAVENTLIVVDFGKGGFRAFRNHHPQRLLSTIKIGGSVWLPDGYGSILRSGAGDCFSVLSTDEEWVPCGQERPLPTRFRLSKRRAERPSGGIPDLSPVSKPIYEAICRWFPRSNDSTREQLAFAVAYDALQATQVEDGLWMATIPEGTVELTTSSAFVVDRIYMSVREWFHHHPAAVCRELAEEIAFEVLDAEHVLGELWSIHVPDAHTPGEGQQ